MKAKTLQIVWHRTEPVFSLDFHPSGILATGGADKDIKVLELLVAKQSSLTLSFNWVRTDQWPVRGCCAEQLWQVHALLSSFAGAFAHSTRAHGLRASWCCRCTSWRMAAPLLRTWPTSAVASAATPGP